MIKVLIADDQELIRQSLTIILNSEKDLEVTDAVANGVEVIRSIRKERPDVILMDIRMPVMNGYDACVAIRELKRSDVNLPIIAMTADAFSDDVQRCKDCGMNAHISKPIDIQSLTRLLQRYVINS